LLSVVVVVGTVISAVISAIFDESKRAGMSTKPLDDKEIKRWE
jgi:hypothetical protein